MRLSDFEGQIAYDFEGFCKDLWTPAAPVVHVRSHLRCSYICVCRCRSKHARRKSDFRAQRWRPGVHAKGLLNGRHTRILL